MRQMILGSVVIGAGVMVAVGPPRSFTSTFLGSVQVVLGLMLFALGVVKLARGTPPARSKP